MSPSFVQETTFTSLWQPWSQVPKEAGVIGCRWDTSGKSGNGQILKGARCADGEFGGFPSEDQFSSKCGPWASSINITWQLVRNTNPQASHHTCAVLRLVTQSCPNLCDPVGCSPPGSSCPWGFSRQEYWSGLPGPPQGDLPNSWIEPRSSKLQEILYWLSTREAPTESDTLERGPASVFTSPLGDSDPC